MIWEEYFPLAFSIGISLEEFKKLTPKTLGYCLKGEELRRKERDSEMWSWWGNYGISAVTFALDHCLNGKKAKTKYLKKPLLQGKSKPKDSFTEADIQKAILIEQQYINRAKQRGLPETILKK